MNLWFKDVKTRVADGVRLRVKSNHPLFPFLFLFLVLKKYEPFILLVAVVYHISVTVYEMCDVCGHTCLAV